MVFQFRMTPWSVSSPAARSDWRKFEFQTRIPWIANHLRVPRTKEDLQSNTFNGVLGITFC